MAADCPDCARYVADAREAGERYTALKRTSRQEIDRLTDAYKELWWAVRNFQRDFEAHTPKLLAKQWPMAHEAVRGPY